jgi:FKBP-type peptidyl-prolyl cis-trans isomerase FklB
MKGLLLLPPLVLAFASAAAPAQDAPALDDESARIQYSVGYQIGSDFRRQGVAIDPAIVARGAEDALTGAEPLMTSAEIDQELAALQQRVVAERRANAERAAAEQRAAGEAFLAANSGREGVQITESGLQYRIIDPGSGKAPKPTDTVRVNYRGTRIDGAEFDSSYKRGKPAEFRLDRVIKGWTEGLQLMKEGGRAEFFIPSALAYGSRGRLADQTLIFEVELLAVLEPEAAREPAAKSSE